MEKYLLDLGINIGGLVLFFVAVWKAFVPKLGQNLADLITAEAKTKIEETVKHSFQVELETLKATLSKEIKVYEIDYSAFHQKRFEVIIALYEKRATVLGYASDCTLLYIPGKDEKECHQQLIRRWQTFDEEKRNYEVYLKSNKLLIEKELFQLLDYEMRHIWWSCYEYKCEYERTFSFSPLDENEKAKCRNRLLEISNDISIKSNDEHIDTCFEKLISPK